MNQIKIGRKVALATSLILIANLSYADEFKKFSVSAGWLHMTSLGKAQPMRIKTAVAEKTLSKVGMISGVTIVNNVDQSRIDDMDPNLLSLLNTKSNPDVC